MAESLELEEFLAWLTPEDATEARVAAARIDTLERQIEAPGWIERNMVRLVVATLVLFVIGVGGLIGVLGWVRANFGLGGVTLMVAAFPVLVFAYLRSVRGQTRADHEKMALNEKHFMPHDGFYYGARNGSGKVVRVKLKSVEMNLREQVEARHAAALKPRW